MAPSFPWLWESAIMAELSEFTRNNIARPWVITTLHDLGVLFWAAWINTLANCWTWFLPKMSICCQTLWIPHSVSANETASSTSRSTASLSNRSSWILLPLTIASINDFLHDSWRDASLGNCKHPLVHTFPINNAMKAQALLPDCPWMFDWDSGNAHPKTPWTYKDVCPFMNLWIVIRGIFDLKTMAYSTWLVRPMKKCCSSGSHSSLKNYSILPWPLAPQSLLKWYFLGQHFLLKDQLMFITRLLVFQQVSYPLLETNFQDFFRTFSRTKIDFSKALKFTLTPTLSRSQC